MLAVVVQWIVVGVLVAACAVYAAWTLSPAAARRRVATAALAWHWPAAAFWSRHAQAPAGCGCDGCDAAPLAAKAGDAARGDLGAGGTKPITFHPRPPR